MRHWELPAGLRELAETGETGIVEEVLTVFRSDTVERIAAMRAACASGDREALRKQAHALKGSSGQVGATALAALCWKLELASAAAPVDELAESIDGIDGEYREVARQIAENPS